jgi:hypothetical protein
MYLTFYALERYYARNFPRFPTSITSITFKEKGTGEAKIYENLKDGLAGIWLSSSVLLSLG